MSSEKKTEAIVGMMLAAAIIAVLTLPLLRYLGVLQFLTKLSVTCAKAIFTALGCPPA